MTGLLAILSPAKTLDMDSIPAGVTSTKPRLAARTKELAATLEGYSPARLSKLMSISDKLAKRIWCDFSLFASCRAML